MFSVQKSSEIEDILEIINPEMKDVMRLNNTWLRDHCRCENCYDEDLFQRKFTVMDIPEKLTRKACEVTDSKLLIEC